jgi:ferredoxin
VRLIPRRGPHAQGVFQVKVNIDSERCQGHGRCYVLAPDAFEDNYEGYGRVLGDGIVRPDQELAARRAAASCPEVAITLAEDT